MSVSMTVLDQLSPVLAEPIKDGAPPSGLSFEQTRFMDIPGRRSHEYFPQPSSATLPYWCEGRTTAFQAPGLATSCNFSCPGSPDTIPPRDR